MVHLAILEDGNRGDAFIMLIGMLGVVAILPLLLGLAFDKTRRASCWLLTFDLAGLCLMYVLGSVFPAKQVGHRSKCMSNLSQLGKAMKMYSMDHDETFPSSFVSLTNYMDNPKLYVCPHSGKNAGSIETVDQWADYILVTNLPERSPSGLVHVYCRPGNHGTNGINTLFVDGSVQWVSASDFGTLTCDVLQRSRINNREPHRDRDAPPGAPLPSRDRVGAVRDSRGTTDRTDRVISGSAFARKLRRDTSAATDKRNRGEPLQQSE